MSKVRGQKSASTSWGGVAKWYDSLVEGEGSYQKEVILPNLLRLVNPQKEETILDLACGQGFFSREFSKSGAKVIGTDISKELIEIAKKNQENSGKEVEFRAAPADKLGFIKNNSIDKITIVLAIQNIENLNETLSECARVLKKNGKLFLVMNHPTFRIPKASAWGNDPASNPASQAIAGQGDRGAGGGTQYRRIDEYMSESKIPIQMHPGQKPSEMTVSFHRPLQVYFKAFKKTGLAVSGLEEWISNKKSQPGPRASAEDKSRKEIPLFMMLEAIKI